MSLFRLRISLIFLLSVFFSCSLCVSPQFTGDVVERLHEAEDDIRSDIQHYHEHIQQDITHGTSLLSSQLASSAVLLNGAISTTGAHVSSL